MFYLYAPLILIVPSNHFDNLLSFQMHITSLKENGNIPEHFLITPYYKNTLPIL